MSFPDFIYAFQVQFYFNEFLCKCADVFNKLLSSPHSPRETVVVPTETTEGCLLTQKLASYKKMNTKKMIFKMMTHTMMTADKLTTEYDDMDEAFDDFHNPFPFADR